MNNFVSLCVYALIALAIVACSDEPKSAAITVGTMAQYRPYSGGRPASMAKATPCGSTATAPTSPAITSARAVSPVTTGHQRSAGRNRVILKG